jgi:hypothetical protein
VSAAAPEVGGPPDGESPPAADYENEPAARCVRVRSGDALATDKGHHTNGYRHAAAEDRADGCDVNGAQATPSLGRRLAEFLEDEQAADRTAAKGYTRTPANGTTQPGADQDVPTRNAALIWTELDGKKPPAREWIVPHWLPAGHVTLLAGRAGIGKTLFAQHLGAALACGVNYIEPLTERRVLMWAGEDDVTELWRRQIQISSYLGHPLSALTGRFSLHSYAGADITLAAPVFGALGPTPLLGELREQVGDYGAELVILDNIARIFGGSENERHAVTTFIAWLQGACAPAALLLLGHPAKSAGSEFSGSTAWEGAVRARLYLSDRPPDAPADEDAPIEERFRFLSRRKANYSALEIRRFTMADGVLIPELPEPGRAGQPSGEFVKDTVRRVVQRLAQRELYGLAGKNSPSYLPKLAKQYSLLDTVTEKAFAAAMRELILSGELANRPVGQYANRTPKLGLVLTK